MQQAIAQLKKKGVRVYGLSATVSRTVQEEEFKEPALFVLGNEGSGIGPAAKSVCDQLLSIPMSPRAESLNVATIGRHSSLCLEPQAPARSARIKTYDTRRSNPQI